MRLVRFVRLVACERILTTKLAKITREINPFARSETLPPEREYRALSSLFGLSGQTLFLCLVVFVVFVVFVVPPFTPSVISGIPHPRSRRWSRDFDLVRIRLLTAYAGDAKPALQSAWKAISSALNLGHKEVR